MERIRTRSIEKAVKTELKSRMIFVGGPRQVGKTTFCTEFFVGTWRRSSRLSELGLGKKEYEKDGLRVLPVQKFCRELEMP